MLAKRIVPCLDLMEGRVVKGINFVELREAGDPPQLAAQYYRQGADELVLLDITASVEKRGILLDLIRRTSEQVFIPLTAGGGIRRTEEIRDLLRAGADKVAMNTGALSRPKLIAEASALFGSQCVVVAIDAKGVGTNSWEVYSHGGRQPTGRCLLEWAREAVELGAGELLITSIDGDGTKEGYDEDLYRTLSEEVNVPLIASGGAGSKEDFYRVLIGGADAVLAASLFHYGELSIAEVKEYLAARGLPIRETEEPAGGVE